MKKQKMEEEKPAITASTTTGERLSSGAGRNERLRREEGFCHDTKNK